MCRAVLLYLVGGNQEPENSSGKGLEFMAEYLAHISEDGRQQTVKSHLDGTATLCGGFAAAFGAEKLAWMVGLSHDIGKNRFVSV